MGVYNCSKTLAESIDSLLAQTEKDWELILCDDGSTDQTSAIAASYCQKWPEKIRFIRNEQNLGLNKTLNYCLRYAQGYYIARQDGDDVSLPTRFEKERRILDDHPEYAIVSSSMELFDKNGVWGRTHIVVHPNKSDFLKGTPFCHAASMVRKEAFDTVHGYSESKRYIRVEDFDLWVKMYAAGFKGMNIDEPLYCMRDDRNAASRRKFQYRINEARVISKAVKYLDLPFIDNVYSLRPIIVGILPNNLYRVLHRTRQRKYICI